MAGYVFLLAIAYGIVAFAGIVLNMGSILAFTSFKPLEKNVLDPATLNLILQNCACGLLISGIDIPLCMWNLLISDQSDNRMFYNDSAACWVLDASREWLLSSCVWLILSLGLTRVLAVYWPHHYEFWLRKYFIVRWILYLTPWLIPYGLYLLSFLLVPYSVKTSGGLCVKEVPPVSVATKSNLLTLLPTTELFIKFIVPLSLEEILVAAIFIKLWLRLNKRSRQTDVTLTSRKNCSNVVAAAITETNQQIQQRGSGAPALFTNNKNNKTDLFSVNTKSLQKHRIRRSLQLMAWSHVLAIICIVPASVVFKMLYASTGDLKWFWALMGILQFFSCCGCPVVYILTMSDVRRAYVRFYKSLKFW